MSATKQDFQSLAISLSQKTKRSDKKILNAFLVPTEFNFMGTIKNARSNPVETVDTLNVVYIPRSFNVVFEKPYTLSGNFPIHDATTMFLKKKIKRSKSCL